MLLYGANSKERIKPMQKLNLFVLFFMFWHVNANAFSVEHTFFVTVGSFDACLTTFRYDLTPARYAVTSDITTNGIFNSIYPFVASYTTSGRITEQGLVTTDYGYSSKSRFNTRTKKVFYNQNGQPLYRISSKNNKSKKQEFSLPNKPVDTYDLQTIIAKLTKQYSELGFCNSKQTVFDGKHYFSVEFNDEGEETLQPNQHSMFSGKAAKCSLKINKETTNEDDTLWQFASQKDIYFWIAKDRKYNHPFIAQIKIKQTPLGELTAYLSNLKVED